MDEIPIFYNGGAYGSFLFSILDIIDKKKINVENIFGRHGNSHKYILENKEKSKFVRIHPKQFKSDSIPKNIDNHLTAYNKGLLIYPTETTTLLNLNNKYFKISESWFDWHLKDDPHERSVFLDNLYNNWDIKKGTNLKDIPRWILREFLSFNLMPQWHDEIEWNLISNYAHPRLYIITLDELLFNFDNTIKQVCEFCNLTISNELFLLVKRLHSSMILLQEHIKKDTICNNIIKSFLNNTDCNIKNLSLVDESWIQWKLRTLGYEIRCDGLNIFPSTVKDLKLLTEKI